MNHRRALLDALACWLIAAAACSSSYDRIRALEHATVPAGDRVPDLDEPVQSEHALQFTWDFDSHLDPRTYMEWVSAELAKCGFTVQSRNDALELSRVEGGDAYRLRIDVVSSAPTHVRIGLRASPD